ncbi:MAG: asparagine synthase (glutamine-hydrolyzing) [Rhodothermia bacterium]
MCGISGILTLDGGDTSEREVVAMTKSLAHRGPDGEGIHVAGPIGLGHRRLAVLDLEETGNQPMSFAGGRYWITYNGEIYNFLELRSALKGLGHCFRGNSDTEVILAAYVQWGEECQLRFNGMWALAIWDAEERRLFLSRDRFGVKPLFYFFDGRRLAFASEMKAFLPLPWFPVAFDPPAVTCSLANPYGLEPTEHCLLKGLKRLKAGYSLTISHGGEPRISRWWRTADHLEDPPSSFELQVEGFRERFQDAVQLRMRSDIPLACSLSGGLDSSSIVGAMMDIPESARVSSSRTDQPVTAFIASFPGTTHDEVDFAREVAGRAGIAKRVFDVEPSVLPGIFDTFVFQCEEIQSPNLGPWMLYRELSDAGIRVSLEGHGGDELLAGYVNQVQFALNSALQPLPNLRRAAELTSILRRMTGSGEGPTTWRDWAQAGRRYAALVKGQVAERVRNNGVQDPAAMFRWIRVPPLKENPCAVTHENVGHSPVTEFLFADFHERTIPGILRDFDRYSMAHGVEVRSPFLDWRVVCYCFSLPSTSVLGGGFTKRILREAMRGRLPEAVRTRSLKIPFKSPMSEWWDGPLLELVRDTVNSKSFLSNEWWDGPGLRNLVESTVADDHFDGALMVFRFVVAHRLMELFQTTRVNHPSAASA